MVLKPYRFTWSINRMKTEEWHPSGKPKTEGKKQPVGLLQ